MKLNYASYLKTWLFFLLKKVDLKYASFSTKLPDKQCFCNHSTILNALEKILEANILQGHRISLRCDLIISVCHATVHRWTALKWRSRRIEDFNRRLRRFSSGVCDAAFTRIALRFRWPSGWINSWEISESNKKYNEIAMPLFWATINGKDWLVIVAV